MPVTVTLNKQFAPVANVPPVRVMVLPPVMVSELPVPQTVFVVPFVALSPAGSTSVNVIPETVDVAGLVIVKPSVEVPPTLMTAGLNVFTNDNPTPVPVEIAAEAPGAVPALEVVTAPVELTSETLLVFTCTVMVMLQVLFAGMIPPVSVKELVPAPVVVARVAPVPAQLAGEKAAVSPAGLIRSVG